ncbi:MAG: hypothetical protein AB2A00_22765 [Myxococcota bacterium]
MTSPNNEHKDDNWTAPKLVFLAIATLAVAFTVIHIISDMGLRAAGIK